MPIRKVNGNTYQEIAVVAADPVPVSVKDAQIVVEATIPGVVEISNDAGSPIPASVASLPLPTGAATEAKQDTLIGHVDGVETQLGGPSDAPASSPTATASFGSLIRLGLQNWATLLARVPTLTLSSGRLQVSTGQDQALTDTQLRASAVPVAPGVQFGSGSVTASTQRVTLAEGGPAVTSLSSIDAKTPSLVSGNVPVQTIAAPTDPTGTGTRQYDWANGLRQAFTATSTAATALPTLGVSREVMFHAGTSRCFVRFGDSNVAAATVGAGQMVVEAGERFHIRIPTGTTHFRVIRDTADGNLNVTAVL